MSTIFQPAKTNWPLLPGLGWWNCMELSAARAGPAITLCPTRPSPAAGKPHATFPGPLPLGLAVNSPPPPLALLCLSGERGRIGRASTGVLTVPEGRQP